MCFPAIGAAVVGQATAATMTATQLAILGATMTASVVGAGVSAKASYSQGKFAEKMAKNNAISQQHMAEAVIEKGKRDEMNLRMTIAQKKGEQRAALGASGRDVESGSASDIQADAAMVGELDALTLRSNAELEAYGHTVGAQNSIAQGRLDRSRGDYGAAGSLLSGASKVGGQWYRFRGG